MKLSDGEKLILLMIADLQEKLKIDGEFDPKFIKKTIYSGHLWGFNWQFTGIPFERPETDPDVVTETADILDMWWLIEEAYEKLSKADKDRVKKDAEPFGDRVRFSGFDGNNERHYGVASYLIDDLKRFSHFRGRSMNSHHQSVPGYMRMYRVFEPLRAGLADRSLNAEEITAILKAKTHPDHAH